MTTSTSKTSESQAPKEVSRLLGTAVLCGAGSAIWATVLWGELLRSRTGGTAICAFGDSDCAQLWDAAFAGAVQRLSGLPVAGWGLVWGLVALLLPLLALVGLARGERRPSFEAGTLVMGLVGVVGVAALLAASAVEGMFCSSCALTYLLTIAFVVVCALGWSRGWSRSLSDGLVPAAGATLAAYALLLYPGLRTPSSGVAEAGDRALRAVTSHGAEAPSESSSASSGRTSAPSSAPAAGGADVARLLDEMIASLPPEAQQHLSDSLLLYRNSPRLEQTPPRALHGPESAPVRIAEFTDPLCPHCATLFQTLGMLRTAVPEGSFAVDSRLFPLDGNCNAHLEPRGPAEESVRCVASKARVCLEDSDFSDMFVESLFAQQDGLTVDLVYEAAAPFVARGDLEACLADSATDAKLAEDVEFAWRYEPDGTPLVLVNGKRGTSYGPFLYAIILTGGSPDHPSFARLPTPNPNAHLH